MTLLRSELYHLWYRPGIHAWLAFLFASLLIVFVAEFASGGGDVSGARREARALAVECMSTLSSGESDVNRVCDERTLFQALDPRFQFATDAPSRIRWAALGGGLSAMILGAILHGGEWANGYMSSVFLRKPRRTRVIGIKTGALSIGVGVSLLITLLLLMTLEVGVGASRGTMGQTTPTEWLSIVGLCARGGLVGAIGAAVGSLLGSLFRAASGALTFGMVYGLIDLLVGRFAPGFAPYTFTENTLHLIGQRITSSIRITRPDGSWFVETVVVSPPAPLNISIHLVVLAALTWWAAQRDMA